ncbi:MAG TPA: class I SAM-dependent methyltransferase family protein [Candidatus Thermoplasmatota archaeon]|nr:class I SAM-dependent methyltransferase family protein [Candidatus Thermoplasmatota archaeon]
MPDERESDAVRVPRREGEAVRARLLEEGRLRTDLRIRGEGDDLLIPVESAAGLAWPVVRAPFEPQKQPPPPYAEVARVPDDVRARLPSSYDVVGSIVLVKIPEDLLSHRRAIGEALVASIKPAKTALLDRGVKGAFRVRDVEVLAGEPTTETEVVENGLRLAVDVATCYFSPRLATERKRVADLVRPGERVLDLFAGVGPFALAIAKHARPARVDAVDLNPDAVKYLKRNIARNKLAAPVTAACDDARAFARAHPGAYDRIVMNLPHTARAFFADALVTLAAEGGVVHLHAIMDPARVEALVAELQGETPRSVALSATREVRTYSPQERHLALDLSVGPG